MSKAKCLKCNDIIESKHRHDFVKCSCEEIFLDGGDEYIRAGANDPKNLWVYSDGGKNPFLNKEEALQKLIEEVVESDMFDDNSFLDDDFDDFNLGYQAGTLDERDRILRAVQAIEEQSHKTKTPIYQDTLFDLVYKKINNN